MSRRARDDDRQAATGKLELGSSLARHRCYRDTEACLPPSRAEAACLSIVTQADNAIQIPFQAEFIPRHTNSRV